MASWRRNEEHDGIEISFDGKPSQEILAKLKMHGFRWSSRQSIWYSKDNDRTRRIAEEVTVQQADEPTGEKLSFAERMEAKREHLEARQERLEERAQKLDAQSTQAFNKAHSISEHIPFGQPILVGHHSEGKHRRDLERINSGMSKAVELYKEAEQTAQAAEGTARHLRQMEDVGVTQRRVKRLEADKRVLQRRIAEYQQGLTSGKTRYFEEVTPEKAEAMTKQIQHDTERLAEIQEQIDYWNEQLEESGARIWSPADFAKCDKIQTRFGVAEVTKVNPKSLTVYLLEATYLPETQRNGYKVDYDEIKGKEQTANQSNSAMD
jgi:chaperonin cofactor prefoldin